MTLLASNLGSLDATWYFFSCSGLFILVTAATFGMIGLWIGALTWGRYKRRWRAIADQLEAMKSENALLKRRSAELANRAVIARPPAGNVVSASLAALIQPRVDRTKPPASRAFSIWTEDDWTPAPVSVPPLPPGRGFTIWPMPVAPAPAVPMTASVSLSSSAGDTLVFAIEHKLHIVPPEPKLPPSRAFCVWTEPSWHPQPVKPVPLPKSAAFCIWTADDWMPPAPPKPPGSSTVAHGGAVKTFATPTSVSTVAAPTSAGTPGPRGAATHLPKSAAFSIWTESPPAPAPVPATTSAFASWLQAKAEEARHPAGQEAEAL